MFREFKSVIDYRTNSCNKLLKVDHVNIVEVAFIFVLWPNDANHDMMERVMEGVLQENDMNRGTVISKVAHHILLNTWLEGVDWVMNNTTVSTVRLGSSKSVKHSNATTI